MLIHADSTFPKSETELAVEWRCKTCGCPTAEPSSLMARAWCRVCEYYGVPVQAVAA